MENNDRFELILLEHPFFKTLDPHFVELIAGCSKNVRFDSGQFIAHEGDPADKFYLIRHGKVSVEIFAPGRGSVVVDTATDGEVLGWSWIVPPYVAHFDARAVEMTRAIEIDGKCLRSKCEADNKLGYEVMKRFAQLIVHRLQATRLQLLDLYGD